MAKERGSLKLAFTHEQQGQPRKEIGRTGDTLELRITELEERIAPSLFRGG